MDVIMRDAVAITCTGLGGAGVLVALWMRPHVGNCNGYLVWWSMMLITCLAAGGIAATVFYPLAHA